MLDEVLARPVLPSQSPEDRGPRRFRSRIRGRHSPLLWRVAKEDIVATATALTAQSIADSIRNLLPGMKTAAQKQRKLPFHDLIVSGGGAGMPR